MTPRERGKLGGKATLARYGRRHFVAIGKLGFNGLAKRLGFMGGSRRTALRLLRKDGRLSGRRELSAEELVDLERAVGLADDEIPS